MKKNQFKFVTLFLIPAFLFACSSLSLSPKRNDPSAERPPKAEAAPAAPVKIVEAQPLKTADLSQVPPSANVKAAHDEVEKQLSKADEKKDDDMSVTLKPLPGAAHVKSPAEKAADHEVEGVAPEVALGWLKNGNKRFLTHHLRADGQSLKDVKRLASGQKPHTIVFACSDSRAAPEIIFDEKLGELFVIRTAGEALDPVSIGSAEYALQHLGARQILVLGHTNCGAVKAACGVMNGEEAGSGNLNALVQDILPRIEQFKGKTPSPGYVDEVWANTEGVAEDLRKRSPVIDKMVKDKHIQISTAIYNLDTGKVSFK
jgi:carbonic anhydrase